MEVPMEQTKQNKNHPKKGDSNPNPNAISETIKISEIPAFLERQEEQNFINRQKELDKFLMLSDNTFDALVKEGKPFFALRQLNAAITNKLLGSLIDELILLRNNPDPITALKTKPLQAVWSAFFESYDGTTTKSLTNSANATQSFRNMLACFPSKIKSIMKELNEQGLQNSWSISQSSKKPLLEQWQVAQLDAFLQEKGVLNPSMDLSSRYKVFKSLKGKFIEPKKTETTETEQTETK
jgi:hypothetical protein